MDARTSGPSVLLHRQMVRLSAYLLLSTYILWNVWWISHGRLAPSLLKALTGLPCPTTGGTRSLLALLRGDITGSLYYNPMTLPIIALMMLTIVNLFLGFIRRQRLSLAAWYIPAWMLILLLAWVIKLSGSTGAW